MGHVRQNISRWLDRVGDLRRRHLSDNVALFLAVTVVGVLSGVCAFVLKRSIAWVSDTLTAHLDPLGFNWILIALPLVGIVLTGIITRYVLRARLAHGVRQLKNQLHDHDYYIAPSRMVDSMIASTVTLGFGGSAGSEGPVACTGAAIGGNLGRWLRMDSPMVMMLIGCGAGAGIAGIFKAPLGGALFTLEVMRLPMSTTWVLALLVCTIAAGMTAYALGGFTLDLSMADAGMALEPSVLLLVVALAIVCGFYSLYYNYVMKIIERLLGRLRNQWIRNIVGGTILSAGVFLLPSLYGEGYGVVGRLLNDEPFALIADGGWACHSGGMVLLIVVALATVAIKCFATSATNSGGGVAGDFAPTLFAGAVVGFLFAASVNYIFGTGLPVGLFALAGMAGVMAGVIRAPLMAMMLTMEMVGGYSIFLPLVISATVSFGVVRLFTSDSFYNRHPDRYNGAISKLPKPTSTEK